MSRVARILAVVVFGGAMGLAALLFILDSFSDDPSSTAPIVFPVLALYGALAVGLIALVDWAVRRVRRPRRVQKTGTN
jgi:hypothetical protein